MKIKINAVALKGVNDDEFPQLIAWAHGRGMDLTLIEVMPLGEIGEGRLDQYLPLSLVRARLAEQFTLEDIDYRTGGPARYVRVAETGGKLGFITPLTHNFCESCNRVRVTCTGTLYMCLGQEDAADLRKPLRASEGNEALFNAIDEAIGRKPKGHDFIIDRRHRRPALATPYERHRRLERRMAISVRQPCSVWSTVAAAWNSAKRNARRSSASSSRPHCSIFQSSSTCAACHASFGRDRAP